MGTEQFTQLSDRELLAEINSGQEDVFVILYDRHAVAAYRHILFRSGSKEIAEDVVSQTFLRIWDYLRRGGTIESFRAFLFQTARNIFIDTTRKRGFKDLSLEEIIEEKKIEPRDQNNLFENIMIGEKFKR